MQHIPTADEIDAFITAFSEAFLAVAAQPHWKTVDLSNLPNGIICGPQPGDEGLF